jgi:cytochrome b561
MNRTLSVPSTEAAIPGVRTVVRYHPVLVFLHWGLAIFILAALALGALKMAPMANSDPMKQEALRAHMTGGLLILLLMLSRLVVRRSTLRPAAAHTGTPFFDRLARFSHVAFYVLVIAQALSGLTMGIQTGVIGIVAGGHPPLPADFWAFPIRTVHYLISRALLILIALHLSGVLYHTFFLRDHLLRRMGFGNRFGSNSMSSTLRIAPIFARIVLLFQGIVLTLIASRSLLDPVAASAKDQIALGSPLAIVVSQIGFGAFPLAVAIFVLMCAFSARRLRTGLMFILIVDLTALLVRAHGVMQVGGFAENRGPFIGETVFSILAIAALIWEGRHGQRNVRGLSDPTVQAG